LEMKNQSNQSKSSADTDMRLNKYLANAGIAARRKCDELIRQGLVKVNGNTVTEPGFRIKKDDSISFRDKKVFTGKKYYVLLNKPRDFITTTDDEHERKTVMDLIKNASPERLYPVGRLDRNTSGVLLLTNDGELTEKLTHPSKKVKKIYEVRLDRALPLSEMEKISRGVQLEDGLASIDEIAYADPRDRRVIGIEIHMGKNRIVRRIFEHFGYRIERLDRTYFAGLTKKNLQRGHWRHLSEQEVRQLKYFT
jgi:23S rRNA pseudouridine2605 synthase